MSETTDIQACIQACQEALRACQACVAGDIRDNNGECIAINLDCADICEMTGRVLSRQTAYDAAVTRAVLEACATACKSCGDECAQHGEHGMQHCQVCAEACRRCEQACRTLLAAAS